MTKKVFKTVAASFLAVLMMGTVAMMSCSAAVVTDGSNFYPLGDTNKDSKVNIVDILRYKKVFAEVIVPDFFENGADVNFDRSIDTTDLTKVAHYIIGTEQMASGTWNTEIK